MQLKTAALHWPINHREIGSMVFNFSDFPRRFPCDQKDVLRYLFSSQTLNSQLDIEFLENYLSILSQTGVNISLGNPATPLKKQGLFSKK